MRGARGGGNIHAGINGTGPGIFFGEGRARDGLLELLVRGLGCAGRWVDVAVRWAAIN